MTDQNIQAVLELERLRNAQNGNVSVAGIQKFWPQIVAVVAIGWFLVGQGREQERMNGRLEKLEQSSASIAQLQEVQAKTTTDVRDLQVAVGNITAGQKELAVKVDSLGNELRVVGQQVSSLTQVIRESRSK